jgi:hypothetical protein
MFNSILPTLPLGVLPLLLVVGCTNDGQIAVSDHEHLAKWDSAGYREIVGSFKYSLADAGVILRAYLIRQGTPRRWLRRELGVHALLSGNNYVFTPYWGVGKADPIYFPLWGYYVNGESGEVHSVSRVGRSFEPSVSEEEQKRLWGEQIIPSPDWRQIANRLAEDEKPTTGSATSASNDGK